MTANQPTLYLIDAPMYVFRAYHSLPPTIIDPRGRPAHAVYGYTAFVCKLLTELKPGYVTAAFDESFVSSFRNELYAPYKANREAPPQELVRQFEWCQEITAALGITSYASEVYEAEDLLASIARKLRPKGFRMVFISGDKDLAQLIEAGDLLWDYAKGREITEAGIKDAFGVTSTQIPDLLALVGDAVDNIPGVPGIGHKTACALLARFGNLDGLYRRLDEVVAADLRGASRVAAQLAAHRDQAFLSRRLACIDDRVRLSAPVKDLRWAGVDLEALDTTFRRLGFGERLWRRCHALTD